MSFENRLTAKSCAVHLNKEQMTVLIEIISSSTQFDEECWHSQDDLLGRLVMILQRKIKELDTPTTCGFCDIPCGNEHCCMKGE